MDGIVQVLPARVVCHCQPFQAGARANAKRGCDGAAFAVHRLKQFGDRRGNAVDVELKIPVGGLNPAGVQQCDGGVEDRAHVVQPGLEHVAAVDVLRVNVVDGVQHRAVFSGGQGCQRNGLLDAEDARVAGSFGAAGVDEGFGFSHDGLARAVVFA